VIGWSRAFGLMLLAGPLFLWLGVGGYAFAPLAHAAVVQPASVMIGTTVFGGAGLEG
jgi:hypothetical protein